MRAVSGRASRLRLHHLVHRNGTVSRGSVSSRLVPPSEGGLFSRISASPSEGAQSPEALCSACTRDSVTYCLLPPSEGELFSRISASPSEGEQSPEALCSACTRDSVTYCLVSPSEGALSKRHCCKHPFFCQFVTQSIDFQRFRDNLAEKCDIPSRLRAPKPPGPQFATSFIERPKGRAERRPRRGAPERLPEGPEERGDRIQKRIRSLL